MLSDEYANGARTDVPPSRKIGRLKSPKLIDVALGADVKPDILKDLLQVDVPDIRKSVDGACKANSDHLWQESFTHMSV